LLLAVALLVTGVVVVTHRGGPAAAPPSAPVEPDVTPSSLRPTPPTVRPHSTPHPQQQAPHSQQQASRGRLPEAPLSQAGPGAVKDLKPALRHAILAAIFAARQDGVRLDVNSGYRTPQHQAELYEQGIAKYGSAQAAHAWVLPPGESDHVKGEAADVEPAQGIAWLEKNGVHFGLCRKYANEDWHFELLAPAIGSTCPPLLPHA
jgi:LAS superfamily LD-carboxypeptidase LdcB